MKKSFLYLSLAILFAGCAAPKEYVMPFLNFGYTGDRLFPVSKSDADFEFRAWVNYSTSIDRVVTISSSKDFGFAGKLLEIRKNTFTRSKTDNTTFKQINIVPRSGFEGFIAKADSLKLLEEKDQVAEGFTPALHSPFSLYVIEIKKNGKVNQFRFNTYFPGSKEPVEDKYQRIQKLIAEEFQFDVYPNK
ncbi:hypothetical protein [Mucilaginibacter flavus]|uniref:hypothetical protein n=1 Tax=Mucilaginibacter flavus TaxID=931504 RepID=UPI0025B39044|nr:hypothetical protein [Mucilaginibacter flavus]MDN3582263.1 hypothetical protein [Mucilaginibacter flavus]